MNFLSTHISFLAYYAPEAWRSEKNLAPLIWAAFALPFIMGFISIISKALGRILSIMLGLTAAFLMLISVGDELGGGGSASCGMFMFPIYCVIFFTISRSLLVWWKKNRKKDNIQNDVLTNDDTHE